MDKWKKWYAWYPIKVWDGSKYLSVWLKYVWCKADPGYINAINIGYNYKLYIELEERKG